MRRAHLEVRRARTPLRRWPATAFLLVLLGVSRPATAVAAAIDLCHPPPIKMWSDAQTRWRVLGGLRSAARLTAVVETDVPGNGPGYQGLLEDLARGQHRGAGLTIKIVPIAGASRADLTGPLLIAGTSRAGGDGSVDGACDVIQTIVAATGYPVHPGPAPGESLRIVAPNPWDPAHPMLIITGSDEEAVRSLLGRSSRIWPDDFDYEVRRQDTLVRFGRLAAAADGRGKIDPLKDTDLRPRIRSVVSGHIRAWYVQSEVDESAALRAADVVNKALAAMSNVLAPRGDGPVRRASEPGGVVELRFYPHLEAKALRTGDARPSHLSEGAGPPPRVHLILPADGSSPDLLGVARAVLSMTYGPVEIPALADGAAVFLAGGLMGKDLDWWAGRLAGSGAILPARDLLDSERYRSRSYLAGMSSAALFVRWISSTRGNQALRRALEDASRLGALSQGFDAYAASISRRPVPAASGKAKLPFQRGVGLAHEGYGVVDGYGSGSSRNSMARLKSLGADWIALSPYAFMRSPTRPEIRFQRAEVQSAGSENDYAVLDSIRTAHELGLGVLLKPQIWLSGGHWTGDVSMPAEADWDAFFVEYRDFILHYALLAAAAGADLLSIGVELQATTTRRAADWRALIGATRGAYEGPLTYAANWGGEFETLPFWDALDFAGLDCYYPLASSPTATDEQIAQGAREAAARAREVAVRSGRPVILTEVGFPALASALTSPHDDESGSPGDAAAQARGYSAILHAFWDQPWLAGLYWWKWPTTPPSSDPAASRDPLFSPRDRPAEGVVATWYRRPRKGGGGGIHWPTGSPY